jgi:hypothetical protein
MFEGILAFVVFGAVSAGIVGAFLGSTVNKGFAGFFLGFFLGPIGWIIVFLLPRDTSISSQTLPMTYFYYVIFVVLVVTILAVLFLPGVDDFVEQTFQRYLGRAAR